MFDDETFNNFFLCFDRIAEAARFDEGQKLGFILVRSDDLDNKHLKGLSTFLTTKRSCIKVSTRES